MKTRLFTAVALLALVGCGDPQKADWGFGALRTMQTPKDDPSLGCGLALPADALAQQRTGCTFGPGAKAADTLGIAPADAAKIPIRHVIILMKENRSFDHLLGKLHDRGQPDVEPIPADYANTDLAGASVKPFNQPNTCLAEDPGHQSKAMQEAWDHGKMDGFVKSAATSTGTDGHWAVGYYDENQLPFYYFLAKTYVLSDRHFAPMVSGTYGNRSFFLFGESVNVVDTGIVYPPPNTPSILAELIAHGFTWGAYSDGSPLSGTVDMVQGDPGVHTIDEFLKAVDDGTLPNVSFVDGEDYITDDHPDADLQVSEAWTKKIYDHVVTSPEWPRIAMFWTYDEGGGFFDHVAPPPACKATPDSPFAQNGPRVPLVAISPWAKKHYVSHVAHDHTAMTRFIELLFDLPALTARDANSDALLDLFDFSCPNDPKVPDAPDAGTGMCVDPAPPGTN